MIIVTRHQGLVDYLIEEGIAPQDAAVVQHADILTIAGQDVIGVLPLDMAEYARSVTVVPLTLPASLRGEELTKEQVRQYAGKIKTFSVYDRTKLERTRFTLNDGSCVHLTLDNQFKSFRTCNCESGKPATLCDEGSDLCG